MAGFMQHVFPRAKWGVDGWTYLMAGRWESPGDPCAVTVRDAGQLVGVLGMVCARRPTSTGPKRWANLTSWYVLAPYRGQGLGQRMMEYAGSIPDVTLTNFSSAPKAVPVVHRAGLVVLDDTRCIWHARTGAGVGLKVSEDPAPGGLVGQILADHAGLPLRRVEVQTPDGPLFAILAVQQKHDDYVTHEVLHLSDAALFCAHARSVADALLPEAGAVLSLDRRFVQDINVAEAIEPIEVPRFYTPGQMMPAEVDPLYSEIVLLNMKMY